MATVSKLTPKNISDLCSGCDARKVQKVEVPNRGITKIEDLSSCAALERLDVCRNSLSSLKGIAGCASLTWLNVAYNNLSSLKGVESLVNLVVLNASHNSISASGHLSSLRKLKALILSNNALKEVQGLESLRHLNALVLSSNQFEVVDVSKLHNLEKLSLSHSQLQSIPDTSRNKKLKELRVNGNQLSHVPPTLQANTLLQLCDLGNNLISKWKNVSALCELKQLKSLNLKGNELCSKGGYEDKVQKLFSWVDIVDGRKQTTSVDRKETPSKDKLLTRKQSSILSEQDGRSSKSTKSNHKMPSKDGGRRKPSVEKSAELLAGKSCAESKTSQRPTTGNVDEQVLEDGNDLLAGTGGTYGRKVSLAVPKEEGIETGQCRKRKHSQMQTDVVSSTGGFAKERAESRPATETRAKVPKKQKSSQSNRKHSGIVKIKHVQKHLSRRAESSESLQKVLGTLPTDLFGIGKAVPSW